MDIQEQIGKQVEESVHYIRQHSRTNIEIGIILGSGMAGMSERIEKTVLIPFEDITNFPVTFTPGHEGNLIIGKWAGKNIVVLQGRVHFYEGYTMKGITFPVRVLHQLGVRSLLLTNAAGILNPDYRVGDIMFLKDHINLMGSSPLIGIEEPNTGPNFIDLSKAYNPSLINIAEEAAKINDIEYRKGVYVGVSGPNYETNAECEFLRRIGGDAVGMSTVPEVIVARQLGVEVFSLSCLTNKCGGRGDKISHNDVLERVDQMRDRVASILFGIVEKI